MTRFASVLVLASTFGIAPGADLPKGAIRVTIGKETIAITGPRDKDGRIDYAAALNEHLKRGVTPDNNSVVLLWKALGPKPEGGRMPAKYFELLGSPEPPEAGDYYVNVSRFVKEHLKRTSGSDLSAMWDQIDQASRRPWKAEEFPDVAAWLKANETPLAVIVEAAKRERYYNPLVPPENAKFGLNSALLPLVQPLRQVAPALTARAMLRCESKPAEAWQDLLAEHRLARRLAGNGGVIEMLVGCAVHGITCEATAAFLEKAPLDRQQLTTFQQEFASLEPLVDMPRIFDGPERLMFGDMLMLVDREIMAQVAKQSSRPFVRVTGPRTDWSTTFDTANEWFDHVSEALRRPTRKARTARLDVLLRDIRKLPVPKGDEASVAKALLDAKQPAAAICQGPGNSLLRLTIATSTRVTDSADKAQQLHNNLLAAFALARYKLEHGKYPPTLADAGQVPGDLYSAQPLVYRPTENGYLLYSVGANGIDDGGRGFKDEPSGDDLVVRVPSIRKKD